MAIVLAIDAGTTGIRALAIDELGHVVGQSYRELVQHYPRPGWVEHDPAEIWAKVQATLVEVATQLGDDNAGPPAAIGITNQRETVVVWDRRTGAPLHRAIVWQDRRTAARCSTLVEAGHLPLVRDRTGLLLDPYFSATKLAWLADEGGVELGPGVAFGTVDSWILWNLTGGGVHATDPSNASRTLLYDIHEGRWSAELLDLFGLPGHILPEVRPSVGRLGAVSSDVAAGRLAGVPVSGVAGDQSAALFGQACFEAGMTKCTYGTGSFVLMNAGPHCPPPAEGLLSSVAWEMSTGEVTYALEGAIFATGSAIQWLRDGLGIITEASEVEALASSLADAEGVYLVPAFTGLACPWWDPHARGTVVGLSRGTGRAHLARAAVEAMAYQTRDVIEAMSGAASGAPTVLRVDGGASVMDLLLALQADQLQVPVARPLVRETTALGAAWLAGLGEGVWSSLSELANLWAVDVEVTPRASRAGANSRHAGWLRAVERSRRWAPVGSA
ncbi:MAG: glycerol kinase [Acidimicrobiales bacterium]|nr:MAG: glycerol kinase [Acidimicrobiales bacterium]